MMNRGQARATSWFRLRGAVLILVGAFFWPLNVLAVNLSSIVRPERVLGLALLVWLVGMLVAALLARQGMGVEAADNTGFVVVVAAMSGGPLVRESGGVGYAILIVACVLAGWLFVRLEDAVLATALVWGAAVTLIAGPAVAIVDSWRTLEGASAVQPGERMAVELATRPDIFLVVIDGYPGFLAAAQDGLESGQIDVRAELGVRDFEIPISSWTSYWTTMLSIPSLLEMDYPVQQSDWSSAESHNDLHQVLSGSNVLTKALKANGYETHMIESGWSLGACGPEIDRCRPSPLLDEATYLTLRHTAAAPLLDGSPGPYALGTLEGFEWLHDHSGRLSQSPSPDFLFMHVVSPHAPFFIRSDCSVEVSAARSGGRFNISGVTEEARERYFVEQMDCLDRLMIRVADEVEPDDVLIFVSDHGSNRRDQIDVSFTNWSHEAIVERMNTFLAVRLPEDCSVGDEVLVPNLFRVVLGCLSPSTVETLPERMWVNPMQELEPEVVRALVEMRADGTAGES